MAECHGRAPTGPASGMWVVDLDLDPVKKIDGIATLAQLIAQHGEIPKTLMTITPRGGRHLIFSWDNKAKIRNSAGKIGPGIDVRGEGGYVCLPPSRTPIVPVTAGIPTAPTKPPQHLTGWSSSLPNQRRATRPGPARRWITNARRSPPRSPARATSAQHRRLQPFPNRRRRWARRARGARPAVRGCPDQRPRRRRWRGPSGHRRRRASGSCTTAHPTAATAATGPRPIIQIIAGQLPRIFNEAEDALVTSGLPIFSRAGLLVEPVAETMLAAGRHKTVVARLRTFCLIRS